MNDEPSRDAVPAERGRFALAVVFFISLALVGGVLSLVFSSFLGPRSEPADGVPVASIPLGRAIYMPPLPKDAPEDIRDAVLLGHQLMVNTRERLPNNVGNDLTCANCHFHGGLAPGGRNGGLSLVGVAAKYPRFTKRDDYSTDLVARTNGCFERSMNGKALDAKSDEMVAFVTYYHWISKGVPIYADVPWLGVKHLPDGEAPSVSAGKEIYARQCADCHRADGGGTLIAPPLWGPRSYNDGAGMHVEKTFAAFTYYNMPKGNPTLTPAEARDVAAFVAQQPRPHFKAP